MDDKNLYTRPLVSVIMPAYNCEPYIQKAIDSILNQTFQNYEILIADDGSTDLTRKIIDGYEDKRIKRFHNDTNLGNIRTRNKLFEVAKGDLITIQDADDWSHRDRILTQIETLNANPELGACGTNYFRVDVKGKVSKAKDLAEDVYLNDNEELYLWPPTLMIRKEVYEVIGGLNLYFDRLFAEDKYWICLIREKYKVLCLREPLYYYRYNPSSLTKKLDQPRKLVVTSVIDELLNQRKSTGTDWLEQNNFLELKAFEEKLLNNKEWVSEKYRIFSAVSIDGLKFKEALILLTKAFFLFPYNIYHFRTALYLVKQCIFKVILRIDFRRVSL